MIIIQNKSLFFLIHYGLLDDIYRDPARVEGLAVTVLVALEPRGLLVDEEEQHEQEEALGEQVPRGVVDELQVEHVLAGDDRQRLQNNEIKRIQ